MGCLICILLGGISFVEIPVGLMPEIDQPTLSINIGYPGVAPEERETLVSRPMEQIVSSAPGVERVTSTSSEIHVDLNLEKLRALDLSVAQIVDRIRSENLNRPVGPVKEGRFELLLRTYGEYESLEQILDVALTSRDGVPVYVRDIATVEDSHQDIRYYVGVNGVPAMRIIVSKQSGSNTVKVSKGIWAAVMGSNEVATAIIASTLTTIAVFVPVVFMGGYSAQTFQQLAYVVSFSLLCPLLAALTVVPVLSSKLLKNTKPKLSSGSGGVLGGMAERYGRVIGWPLDHRMIVTSIAVGSFASAWWMSGLPGVELEPQVDEGQISVRVELESGTNAETTKAVIDQMYDIVMREVPEAEYVMTEAGQNSPFRGVATHRGELRITLADQAGRERTAADIANVLRPLLMSVVPGSQVRTRIRSGNFGRRRGGGAAAATAPGTGCRWRSVVTIRMFLKVWRSKSATP